MPNKTTLTNSQVNSGSTIDLKSTTVTTDWAAHTSTQDKPRQNTSDSINDSISRGYNTGFANPTHTVQGVIDLDSAHESGASADIDFEYIEELFKNSDRVMTLKSDKFKTSSNTDGSKNVMLMNYSDENDNSNVVTYTMEFVEVSN